MSNLEIMWNTKNINTYVNFIRTIVIIECTYYVFRKIINVKLKDIRAKDKVIIIISTLIVAFIVCNIKYKVNYYRIFIEVLLICIVNRFIYKTEIYYSFLLTTISFGINYSIYMLSVIIAFIPNAIFKIQNDYIGLLIILVIYTLLIYKIFKLKRLKYGISLLNGKLQNSYISYLFFNLCIIILAFAIVLQEIPVLGIRKVGLGLMLLIIVIFITIKESIKLYYKQNLLIKDLESTKKELSEKNEELAKLEKENLEFSKTSHSLAHRQKVLEYKLNKLINGDKATPQDTTKEELKKELEDISKDIYKKPSDIEIEKTGIDKIDNMLEYMKSECDKNNIEFNLQIIGNIHYMVNHFISENDLEILLADHIKDAIIAIQHSTNKNRSILVKIGKIQKYYGIYIYDSGVEFTDEVLNKLGKEPITTHKDSGGTGMGFMNTFDTLKRYNASLNIIKIDKPSLDNYTKSVEILFDSKNEIQFK